MLVVSLPLGVVLRLLPHVVELNAVTRLLCLDDAGDLREILSDLNAQKKKVINVDGRA